MAAAGHASAHFLFGLWYDGKDGAKRWYLRVLGAAGTPYSKDMSPVPEWSKDIEAGVIEATLWTVAAVELGQGVVLRHDGTWSTDMKSALATIQKEQETNRKEAESHMADLKKRLESPVSVYATPPLRWSWNVPKDQALDTASAPRGAPSLPPSVLPYAEHAKGSAKGVVALVDFTQAGDTVVQFVGTGSSDEHMEIVKAQATDLFKDRRVAVLPMVQPVLMDTAEWAKHPTGVQYRQHEMNVLHHQWVANLMESQRQALAARMASTAGTEVETDTVGGGGVTESKD